MDVKNIIQSFLVVFLSFNSFSCSSKKEVSSSIYGSHKNILRQTSPKCNSCLETDYYKFSQRLQQSLKLEPLNYAKDTFHFRFWRVSQVIEIWTTNYKSFGGVVTNFYEKTQELKVSKRPFEKEVKTIKQQHILDSNSAKETYFLIEKYDLLNIPDCKQIEGWKRGLDGFSYIVETSTPLRYSLKTYWSPKENIEEGRKILGFDKSLESLLDLDKLKKEFERDVPSGYYHISGTIINFIKL